jgi:hypothetical protein
VEDRGHPDAGARADEFVAGRARAQLNVARGGIRQGDGVLQPCKEAGPCATRTRTSVANSARCGDRDCRDPPDRDPSGQRPASTAGRKGWVDLASICGLNGLQTRRSRVGQDRTAMCSQADFVHVDAPSGYVPPERKLLTHRSGRQIHGPKVHAAIARSDMTSAFVGMDELTLRMIFGDR